MDDCIDGLEDAELFKTLDCNSGYHQVSIRPEDREKTTFTCHDGTFQWKRMPFGLTNYPATFQRLLDILLSGYSGRTCSVYLDDVIIFSRAFEDHLRHVREVLGVLKNDGISLKLNKCHFSRNLLTTLAIS